MDKLTTAPKTQPTTATLSQYTQMGDKLRELLANNYRQAREIENALGIESRIMPDTDEAPTTTRTRPDGRRARANRVSSVKPARTYEVPPPGTIMHKVYDFLKKHPESMAPAIRQALKMTSKDKSVQISTALFTLKKRNLITISGRRNSFKYSVKVK
jgi:hypothetical protein